MFPPYQISQHNLQLLPTIPNSNNQLADFANLSTPIHTTMPKKKHNKLIFSPGRALCMSNTRSETCRSCCCSITTPWYQGWPAFHFTYTVSVVFWKTVGSFFKCDLGAWDFFSGALSSKILKGFEALSFQIGDMAHFWNSRLTMSNRDPGSNSHGWKIQHEQRGVTSPGCNYKSCK